ncbi:phosphate-selective porin OprO/OprP [Desulfosalsimonas propionicica]|uniref:Phosphate-selective porin OprO/OprP n=1 Tax=Desulfosalsimonas propionicica TaxID=332175 RepID=A0A7W0HK89_9BACT|nr:porin [Desulfosalsimonas propionicica]MBA2880985.1 phosphate-selective porin OprO/OprP [Desulfosalsimonas propionicica]
MKRLNRLAGPLSRAGAILLTSFACVFAFAAGPAAAEKSTTEEILDILKQGDHISDSRYEELTQRVKGGKSRYDVKFGGRIMADWASISADDSFDDDLGGGLDGDGVEFRRARLFASGSFENNVFFKAQYDFAGGDADFKDMYIGMKKVPALGNIKIGHFKEPFSLEEQTSSKYITFMERGLPNVFSPSRNTGIMAYDAALGKRMSWAIGAFYDADGFGDGFNDYTDINLTARVTGAPVYADNGRKAVHLGLSYTRQFRDEDETTLRYRQRPEAHITGVRLANTGSFNVDDADIMSLEAAMVMGPFSVQAEYMQSFVGSDAANDPSFSGYYVYGSYFLTGESRNYKPGSGSFGRVKPNRNFSFQKPGAGAWEVGVRYSNLDLNDEAIEGGELSNLTLGVNWHLNPNVRMMLNYVYADLEDREDVADDNANIVQARFQVDF